MPVDAIPTRWDGLGRRVQAQLGGNTLQFLYGAGNVVLAERANNGAWTVNSFGAGLYQCGNHYLHWNLRGDLAGIHAFSANVPITDAFGAGVSGMRQVYDWNGAWLYRNESRISGSARRDTPPPIRSVMGVREHGLCEI